MGHYDSFVMDVELPFVLGNKQPMGSLRNHNRSNEIFCLQFHHPSCVQPDWNKQGNQPKTRVF